MGLAYDGIAASLVALGALLAFLAVKGGIASARSHRSRGLAWSAGLGLAATAMGIEAAVYLGSESGLLLRTYVFVSASLVGVLSLGVVHLFRRAGAVRVYTAYMLGTMAVVGVLSFLVPLPAGMVDAGIIAGSPSPLLVVASTLVTGPATVLLLTASAVTLRRSWRWQTLLLIGGALILGAGGTLYIASFPVALYYSEFVGIVLLFLGIVSLPHPTGANAPAVRPSGTT